MLITIIVYFALLLIVSRLVGNSSNEAFFRGNRKSPWAVVAFGMIGASLSGATFISVPGLILENDMTYLQMCIGFFFGYLVIAFLLLPIYYKLGLTSIYSWLKNRMGNRSHKTAASFFILSKLMGAAARMYIVCLILHKYVFSIYGISYEITVVLLLFFIWIYTHKSGVCSLVWTDTLQTFCLLCALIIIIFNATNMLNMDIPEAFSAIWNNSHSRIFEFNDFYSRQHFVKQFLSGMFITIVMTGLDQGLMQKNLTCKNLRDAQKDMCSYGIMFIPINLLFLSLGILMIMLYSQNGIPLPTNGDSLMTGFIAEGFMGNITLILFTIGIIAPAFSSADSAITALTTSICIDMLDIESEKITKTVSKKTESIRKITHAIVIIVFAGLVIAFKHISSGSVIDTIYTIASYTYGPILGLFAFGLFTKRTTHDSIVPLIAIASPFICYLINYVSSEFYYYQLGYELLLLNGLITFGALYLSSVTRRKNI